MAEAAHSSGRQADATGAEAVGPAAARPEADAEQASEGVSRVFFALGLGVQTLLWFLLFFALAVAIAVGGELTEFRYVGF